MANTPEGPQASPIVGMLETRKADGVRDAGKRSCGFRRDWMARQENDVLERNLATWFFVGTIFTTLPFAPDTPSKNRCGSSTIGFVRNVCVALGNVGTEDDLPILRAFAGHPDLAIAEHAQWAVDEIEYRKQPVGLEG